MPQQTDTLLSTGKVAKLLDVSAYTVRTYCNQGTLHGTKVNGHWKILRSEVERYAKVKFS